MYKPLFAILLTCFAAHAMAQEPMKAGTVPSAEYTEEHALYDMELLVQRMEATTKSLEEAAVALTTLSRIIETQSNCD